MASTAQFRHSPPPRRQTGGPSPHEAAPSTAWRLAGATMAALAMGTVAGLAMPTQMKSIVGEDWRRNIPRHFAADYTADTTIDGGLGSYLVPPSGEQWRYASAAAYVPATDDAYLSEAVPPPPPVQEAGEAALAEAEPAPAVIPAASGPRVIDLTGLAPEASTAEAAASSAQVAVLH